MNTPNKHVTLNEHVTPSKHVTPANAGVHAHRHRPECWIPAFAGTTRQARITCEANMKDSE